MRSWCPVGAEWDECNLDDITYLYTNPEVTEAFKLMDKEV